MATEQQTDAFAQAMTDGYTFAGEAITLGAAMREGAPDPALPVRLPLATLARHGLVAGATGTGKTKSLQGFAESLSRAGVSVLIMDIKGDVSGISQPGEPNPKIEERARETGIPWQPSAFPVELLTMSDQPGVRLRSTVSELGPVLFSKMLELNANQQGAMALVFKYADDHKLPLVDIADIRATLQYLQGPGRDEIAAEYGAIHPSSAGVIARKLLELEGQGANAIFGEPSFEVADLARTDADGRGIVNILRLADIQDRPKVFSTFMLGLLAEVYHTFPEEGDVDKPKLVFVIDEAHLVFSEASEALLDQLESTIKLIRSKGIGVVFCTQQPTDIPDAVLGQLGFKIQHALRAFTAKDRKSIRLVAQNYPESPFYDVETLLTSLGTGEALVTGLSEKGLPTPLARTMMAAPESRMDTITEQELAAVMAGSALAGKYNQAVDPTSAAELLAAKLEQMTAETQATAAREAEAKAAPEAPRSSRSAKEDDSFLEELSKNTMVRQASRTVVREVTRGLLGAFLGSSRRR
jgi:DNA helicase HerA-like ATPase